MEPESSLLRSQLPATCPYPEPTRSIQTISPVRGLLFGCFATSFYSEELLTPHPTPKLEDNRFSAVRDCLFNIFAANLHIEGRSSIRDLRKRHAVVTGTHL